MRKRDILLMIVGVGLILSYMLWNSSRSFASILSRSVATAASKQIDFSSFDVLFRWSRLCVFGPYTDNAKAHSILKIDWKIEDHSKIAYSDSINTLVFLDEDEVGEVIDLKRGVVDFAELDRCYERNESRFGLSLDANGRKILTQIGRF